METTYFNDEAAARSESAKIRVCFLAQREGPMSESKNVGAVVELAASDLPAHCPNPAMPVWSSHPKVFLDMAHGHASCPYCGTAYRMKAGEVIKAH